MIISARRCTTDTSGRLLPSYIEPCPGGASCSGGWPQGSFIPVGASFTAVDALTKIFGTATASVLIVDPYADANLLTDFLPAAYCVSWNLGRSQVAEFAL